MKITGKRLIATFAAVVATCIAGPAAGALAYTPAPPMHANQTPAHVCQVIGQTPADPNAPGLGYRGVVCMDLWTIMINGHAYATSQIEAICQNLSGSPVQCAEVHANGELWNAVAGYSGASGSGAECGHQYGACSSTRNIWGSGGWGPSSGDCTNQGNEVWAIARGGSSNTADTSIELPGTFNAPTGTWVHVNASNISTGHYVICP